MKKRMKTALLLPGGSVRGAFEVGVLKVLIKKITPDVIFGTSVGSINGAMFLDGPDHAKNLEQLECCWLNIEKSDIFRYNLKILYKFIMVRSIFDPRILKEQLEMRINARRFSELSGRLIINATEYSDGGNVFFEDGSLIDAVIASCSIPPFFPPHDFNGGLYIDGSINEYAGLKRAAELGCRQVIAVNLLSRIHTRKEATRFYETLHHTVQLLGKKLIEHQLKKANIIEIPLISQELDFTDLSHTRELIRLGEEAAKKVLPRIRA
ncbi:MAG: patatin-like phospholipase family protein [archaeon]